MADKKQIRSNVAPNERTKIHNFTPIMSELRRSRVQAQTNGKALLI